MVDISLNSSAEKLLCRIRLDKLQYTVEVKIETGEIVFPDGDRQEVNSQLRFGDIVDVNGRPLVLPLPTVRMLAYRVYRISHRDTRNEEITEYHLEQLFPDELRGAVNP